MRQINFTKAKKYLTAILGISIFSAFSQKISAAMQLKYGVPPIPQPLYGVPIDPPVLTPTPTPTHSLFPGLQQPLYGGPNPPINEYLIQERILLYIILPLTVLAIFIVGLVVFIRNRNKKNAQKNIQKRGS